MQVKEIESTGLKRKYEIVVPSTTISEQVEVELKNAGKTLKIPGFRPGFVPLKVLQQRFGKSVEADVLNNVIKRATGEMIADKKLRPAIQPQVSLDKGYEEGKDLTYTVSLEVFPEVPAVKFEDITLDRKIFEIDEKEIDEAIKRIGERSPDLKPAKAGAKAALGNVVKIDFKGSIDGDYFPGGSAEGFQLELGSHQFIDNFEEQLVGTKAGDDKIVKVTFPDNYPAANLAGKEAKFEVKVHEILTKEAPVVDEAFAKERGFDSVEKFRAAVKDQLNREYTQLVRNNLKKQLFDSLEDTVDFEIPEAMAKLEFDHIWERLKEAQKEGDPELQGKSDAELKEEYEAIANRRVRLGILLADVGNKNNLQISREELTRAVIQQAQQFPGQEQQVMEFYKNHPERLEDLRGPIVEEKAVDYVLGKVKYNDEKVSIEELIKVSEEQGTAKKKLAKAKKAKK